MKEFFIHHIHLKTSRNNVYTISHLNSFIELEELMKIINNIIAEEIKGGK